MIIPQKMTARLSEKQILNERYTWFRFELDPSFKLRNEAGQYVMIEVAPGVNRAYSMCDRPDVDSSFELLVDIKPQGVGVTYLQNLKFGDQIKLLAPLGQLTVKTGETAQDLFFIATGSGISPFKAIITDQLQIQKSNKNLHLLWNMNFSHEFFWLEDFADLQDKYSNFHFYPIVSQPDSSWTLASGYVTNILENIDIPTNSHFYLCGSPLMLDSTTQFLTAKGFTMEQISTEKFSADKSNANSAN